VIAHRISAFLNRVLFRHLGLCLASLRNADHEHVGWRLIREPKSWTPYCGDD
jgi:hypothetical protein